VSLLQVYQLYASASAYKAESKDPGAPKPFAHAIGVSLKVSSYVLIYKRGLPLTLYFNPNSSKAQLSVTGDTFRVLFAIFYFRAFSPASIDMESSFDDTDSVGDQGDDGQLTIKIPNPKVYKARQSLWIGRRGKPRCDHCRLNNLKVSRPRSIVMRGFSTTFVLNLVRPCSPRLQSLLMGERQSLQIYAFAHPCTPRHSTM